MELTNNNDTQNPIEIKTASNLRIVFILSGIAAGMFAFAIFVLPPMYEVFCELTGINGRSDNLSRQSIASFEEAAKADNSLSQSNTDTQTLQESPTPTEAQTGVTPITLQFLADTDANMPWEFQPATYSMKLEPNKRYRTSYHVKNLTNEAITGHAIPSVSPGYMAQYLKKIECFCFTQQTLDAHEEKEMPLTFYLSEDAPKDVTTLTLSYMLYRAENDNSDSDS